MSEDPIADENEPETPLPPPPGDQLLQVYGRRHAGDDVHIIGSIEALTQLRDSLNEFVARCEKDKTAVGRIELFKNPDGSATAVRIRLGTSSISEPDWKVLKPEFDLPQADTDKIST